MDPWQHLVLEKKIHRSRIPINIARSLGFEKPDDGFQFAHIIPSKGASNIYGNTGPAVTFYLRAHRAMCFSKATAYRTTAYF